MESDAPRSISEEELRKRFEHHPPVTEGQANDHADIRNEVYGLAQTMNAVLPDGREKSVVLTKLEEAMFWANAALARARA